MNEIEFCEVCGSKSLNTVLDLGLHPMCDDLVPVGDLREPMLYPITIDFCANCNTAHQRFQVPKKDLFPQSYHYRARHTKDVLDGMQNLVSRCERELGNLKGVRVLDVGCNDGSLLSIFREAGAETVGVEPTGASKDAIAQGHEVYQSFFTPKLANTIAESGGQPDIITFTNVFAHIEDLSSVLQGVNALMSEETLLVIENHYLGSVIERSQFDTFYHEHPRTYSLSSFEHIAKALGAAIIVAEFPARYGGNIRVFMQRSGGSKTANLSDTKVSENAFQSQLLEMAQKIPHWREMKREQIENQVAIHGPLPAKAFPGRAAILVKLLELDANLISSVYEKPGSMKVGHYLPGTRIPILSDNEFDKRPVHDAPLVNLAWHISEEIHGYMRKNGFKGEIIDIFSPAEFRSLS